HDRREDRARARGRRDGRRHGRGAGRRRCRAGGGGQPPASAGQGAGGARLGAVDVLLTSPGSRVPVLEQADVAPIMAARPHRPLLVVDIAMPRDVDSGVGEIPEGTLLDMDDLRRFAGAGIAERRREVTAVEAILNEEIERYLGATSAREVAPMIVALRERAEN